MVQITFILSNYDGFHYTCVIHIFCLCNHYQLDLNLSQYVNFLLAFIYLVFKESANISRMLCSTLTLLSVTAFISSNTLSLSLLWILNFSTVSGIGCFPILGDLPLLHLSVLDEVSPTKQKVWPKPFNLILKHDDHISMVNKVFLA